MRSSARPGFWHQPWARLALLLTVVGWGGNQFTPLMLLYQESLDLSLVAVNTVLSVYVLGLVPALLVSGPASDRFGPRPVTTLSAVAALIGSALMTLGPSDPAFLLVGRFVTGLSVGMGMTAATGWIIEISRPPYELAVAPGAGARRAASALTVGFGLGPTVTAACAQWAPAPQVLPYLLHLVVVIVALTGLPSVPEPLPRTRLGPRTHRKPRRSCIPPGHVPRFRWVVLPAAPWIFGANAISFAVVPVTVAAAVGPHAVGYAALLIALTFSAGVAIQPLARRLDHPVHAHATVAALVILACGISVAIAASVMTSPTLGILASVLLGASYGLNLVSGLREVQRIAPLHRRSLLTGTFYAVSYSGFLLPAVMAALTRWLNYSVMLFVLLVLAVACLLPVTVSARRR
ncbi:MFS transporter [Pseudactinotalea sp. Z1739]|uniref:MFS transporter n=1 Tax=Pseudactinotalea sp. Z1739 TaxID=3413028 RepID=UPI003C7C94D6